MVAIIITCYSSVMDSLRIEITKDGDIKARLQDIRSFNSLSKIIEERTKSKKKYYDAFQSSLAIEIEKCSNNDIELMLRDKYILRD